MNRIFSLTRMPIAPIWGESVLASRLLIHYWFTSSATMKTPQDDKSCLQWRLQGKGREQRWRYKVVVAAILPAGGPLQLFQC